MSLQSAIAQVMTVATAVTGIRDGSATPVEKITVYPFVVCYAARGTWQSGAGTLYKHGQHTIFLEIHFERKGLARRVAEAMGYAESIPDALFADVTLGGTVSHILEPVRYSFGMLGWLGIETIGWRFEVDVDYKSAVS